MPTLCRVPRFCSDRFAATLAGLMLICATAGTAHSAPIGSPGALSGGNTVITFDEFSIGTPGPVTYAGVTIDSTTANTVSVLPQAFTQHAGIFEGQYFGQGFLDYFIDFNGSTVAEFGMGVFDPNFSSNVLRALDINGNVLETIVSSPTDPNFTLGPTGGFHATFVGFVRSTADIARIELIAAPGDLLGIDTITFSELVAPIPEPPQALLLLAGLAGLLQFGRKRRTGRPSRI